MTDYELARLCAEGKTQYFEELVERYKNLVYSVLLRMVKDREEVNDLAQDVFIKLYRNIDKYDPQFRFSTWVIRICTNHVIDCRRKKHLECLPIEDFHMEPDQSDTPEEIALDGERKAIIKETLDDLPEMYRLPVVLYHQNGLSYQEISERINEPMSKVKNRIFRARKMLKEKLMSRHVFES